MKTKVPIYIKYKPRETSHLVQIKDEIDYKYYKCEYCGGEIIIKDKQSDMDGGIATIPLSLTQSVKKEVALHNKCLNPYMQRLEKINK